MTTPQKTIVITGVSTGIGLATARDLVEHGYRVFGSVRREEDAQRVQSALGEPFSPLLFDVTDHAAIEEAVPAVVSALDGCNLTALVNNAGITTPGPLLHMPLEDFRRQIEVNVLGQLDVIQQFAPLLGARHDAPRPRGRIINISSVSGRVAYPFMGAYAASKHALEAISDSLRRELMLYDVDVVLVEPGTVNTGIIGKFARKIERYRDTDYGPALSDLTEQVEVREKTALPVSAVTRVIRRAIESPRPKTRYPIPRKWLTGWLLPLVLPDRWLDTFSARQLGFK